MRTCCGNSVRHFSCCSEEAVCHSTLGPLLPPPMARGGVRTIKIWDTCGPGCSPAVPGFGSRRRSQWRSPAPWVRADAGLIWSRLICLGGTIWRRLSLGSIRKQRPRRPLPGAVAGDGVCGCSPKTVAGWCRRDKSAWTTLFRPRPGPTGSILYV
jgi:hypothetical protein